MMLSDQFLQISTQLPTTFFYGIGENSRTTFKRDFSKWKTIGMFTADHAPYVSNVLFFFKNCYYYLL